MTEATELIAKNKNMETKPAESHNESSFKGVPTPGPWEVQGTYSTHNHPTRYWQTHISSFSGLVATASGYYEIESKANAELIAKVPEMVLALKAISLLGGNLSDDRLTEKTGPNDAKYRGLLYTEARRLARAALDGTSLGLGV